MEYEFKLKHQCKYMVNTVPQTSFLLIFTFQVNFLSSSLSPRQFLLDPGAFYLVCKTCEQQLVAVVVLRTGRVLLQQ